MLDPHARFLTERYRPQSGISTFEFIIILPLVMLLFFATLDLNQFLRNNQVAAVLSRESAARALRRCSTIMRTELGQLSRARTGSAIGSCLQGEIAAIEQRFPKGNNYQLRISVFRVFYKNPLQPTDGTEVEAYSSPAHGPTERYTLDSAGENIITSAGIIVTKAELDLRRVVAVAEVEYGFTPFIASSVSMSGTSFLQLFDPELRYVDATIL